MIKRDDAITIKELVKRSGTNRSRIWKKVIEPWQRDPIKNQFIYYINYPASPSGKMWFIKKVAVEEAINVVRPKKQELDNELVEKQPILVQKQPKTTENKLIEHLEEQVKNQDRQIKDLTSEIKATREDWKSQMELIIKRLPAPKVEEETSPAEKQTDRGVKAQKEGTGEKIESPTRTPKAPQGATSKARRAIKTQPTEQVKPQKKRGILQKLFG